MMTPEQVRIVGQVYRRFSDNEQRGWDSLDDTLEQLEYLEDDQLYREAEVLFSQHQGNKVTCDNDNHGQGQCFVPMILEAVSAILELYRNSNDLHPKNRYILQYYLGLSHVGMIVVEAK